MPSASARIVVEVTPQGKRAITAKARNLGMSVSELMRSGAAAFEPAPQDLLALARAAQEAMNRSAAAVDATISSVAKSNARIEAKEPSATRARARSHPRAGRPRRYGRH